MTVIICLKAKWFKKGLWAHAKPQRRNVGRGFRTSVPWFAGKFKNHVKQPIFSIIHASLDSSFLCRSTAVLIPITEGIALFVGSLLSGAQGVRKRTAYNHRYNPWLSGFRFEVT
jgi:hypothetical protein